MEIGVYRGDSLVHLARKAKKADKDLRIVGVDWGLGFLGMRLDTTANQIVESLALRGLDVPVILWDSSKAASFFPTESIFFAYIDADHQEEGVRRDILAWWPKVAKGGYRAGHDYQNPVFSYPGVKAAVDDIFGPEAGNQPVPGSWKVKKDGSREPGSR